MKSSLNGASVWRVVEEKPLSVWGTDYGGKELTFIKGELLISIEYEGVRKTGRIYAVAYAWDSLNFDNGSADYLWLNEIPLSTTSGHDWVAYSMIIKLAARDAILPGHLFVISNSRVQVGDPRG